MKNEHIIWSSDIDLNDWQDFLEEEHPDVTDEVDQYRLCEELNYEYLEDERINLNIDLCREIVVIGDLGRWNGRVSGYKEAGTRICDCLQDTWGDFATWYLDERGDLRCRDCHHDGVNYYTYRVYKSGLSDQQKGNFLLKVISGKATRRDVTRYTERLGDWIANVYGWKIRKLPARKAS